MSGEAKYTIVLIRHGESEWNQKNLFCGWFDADLSETGVKEAQTAGKVQIYWTGILESIKLILLINNKSWFYYLCILQIAIDDLM